MKDIAVKDYRKKCTVKISGDENVKNAVDLMTGRREAVWVKFDAYRASCIDKNKFNIELKAPGKHHKFVYFLYRSGKSLSRDLTDINELKSEEPVRYAQSAGGELLTLKEAQKAGIFEGAELKITLHTYGEEEANSIFLGEILQFKSKSYSPYIDIMFLDINVKLKPVGEASEKDDHFFNDYADIADLTVYGELRKILLHKHAYNDDLFIEYSISTAGETAYYILDEWYSNHVWALDPAVLYVFKITGHKTEGTFPREELRYKHPIRYTKSIWDKNVPSEDYYIESIDTEFKTNNGIKIFVSATREEENPINGTDSHSNLFEFKDWLEYRDSDIYNA